MPIPFRRKKAKVPVPARSTLGDEVIRVLALSMHFGERRVLKDIDLGISRGEILVVMGPSGCGKTTLLKNVCGLLRPTIGTVFIGGRDIYLLPEDELNATRRRMGLSFQGGALINSMSVLENVMLPLLESTDLDEEIAEAAALLKLEMVDMVQAWDLLPAGISGGMRKRVAIARAMALDPEILFFDEPSAGLDPVTAADLDNLILKLNQVFGMTMMVVTHDLDSAFTIADRMVMLERGEVLAAGTREEIRATGDRRVERFIKRMMEEKGEGGGDFARYSEE